MEVTYNHHEQARAIAVEAYASLDFVPMFIISGQVRYDTTARYALSYTETSLRAMGDQEYDTVKLVELMTKYVTMIEAPEQSRCALGKRMASCDGRLFGNGL